MLAAAIIVFREVLEAALIISIVGAATRGIAGNTRWLFGGAGLGLLGACVVAAFASVIAGAAAGMGQELFNAFVLFAAIAMLAWHNIWMSKHGRELAQQMNRLGADVRAGAKPLYMVLIVVALAVLREGSEVVLFMEGLAASGAGNLLAGGLIGIVGGVALGAILYFGLVRFPVKQMFQITGWLILILAAGMASQAAGYLIQADWLPALGAPVWDSSHIVAGDSLLGQTLHALAGYDARPAGMQLLFFAVTMALIWLGMHRINRGSRLVAA